MFMNKKIVNGLNSLDLVIQQDKEMCSQKVFKGYEEEFSWKQLYIKGIVLQIP